MPVPEALDAFYRNFYANTQEHHVTFGNVARFGRHLWRYTHARTCRPVVRILDYGGGDGAIAVNLADRLVESGKATEVLVIVVDYATSRAEPRQQAVQVEHIGSLDKVENDASDIIIASGVLEHVPDPVATTRTLLLQLKPGGVFYARTPHVLPFMRLNRTRAVERFFPFPAHLHDLGQAFWTYTCRFLLADCGCVPVQSHPAIVQAAFRRNPAIALASHVAKAPWYVFGKHYPFVGGWEVVLTKRADGPQRQPITVPEKAHKTATGNHQPPSSRALSDT